MNDNYDFSDYRAVMPFSGDTGIYSDDETALLEQRDECYAAYGISHGYDLPTPSRRQRPA